MQIFQKKLSEIQPYGNNPRRNDNAVEAVAESIRQFGFKVPIVIDKNNVIVCGHTRMKAAQRLHMDSVPCVVADDLTDAQVKAFRLADNKVSELASWDEDLLSFELDEIPEIDMEAFGFELSDLGNMETGYFGDERERTYHSVNLSDFDEERAAGFYQMPVVKAVQHVPDDLISFNYMLTSQDYSKGIHFYIDDYQFERIWNDPHRYMDRLARFDCCLTPDFSLYMDMPIAMQVWNVYRSRLIGQIMQDAGIIVIPTLQWSSPDSYAFCFDGIEPSGTVSVSTVGVMNNEAARETWRQGMDEAMKRLQPSHVISYGEDIGYRFDCAVTYIINHNSERLKK